MNTGHNGSMTTAHANSPKDLMSRLETMDMMGNMELPLRAIREQIAAALDIVVHQNRFRDGSRKITEIAWIEGMEGDRIKMVPLFVFRPEGSAGGRIAGKFVQRNKPAALYDELNQRGI
ncbi:MAG: Flp pilus assembly complex ATPase component TadA, partial [Firmicutes bacterium]|nr:Flp pilus assembly complex ATPase component TadA [Bacillota bacterium]